MSKYRTQIALAVKGVLYFYLPAVLLFYVVYGVILKRDMNFSWDMILIDLVFIAILTIGNYSHSIIEQDVEDFSSLKNSVEESKWEVIEHNKDRLIVEPKFDFPFRLLIDDKVQIERFKQTTMIEGPGYYAHHMVQDITGKSSIWKKGIPGTGILALVIVSYLIRC